MPSKNNHTVCLAPPKEYKGPKRSLLLAGGGMRVAYQAGVIKALDENGLRFGHADGTSGGTMNLAMLLSGLSSNEMCSRWQTLDVKKFVSLLPFEEYLPLQKTKALGDADGIKEYVFPHLGINVEQIKQATGLQGTFNVCNYTDKISEVIPHQKTALELLIAGISLPIFMPSVKYKGKDYIDSVWIKDANTMEAVKRGAEEIWLVWCIGNHGIYGDGVFNQYVHMIEMSANGVLFEEFERINEINKRIAKGDSPYGQTKPITLHVVKPEYPLPLDPDYYFGRIDASTLISMGYSDTIRYLKNMDKDGIPFTPSATRMKDPVPGIAFREKMEGWFALGDDDPAEGARKGEEIKSKMALHASIVIRDVEEFMQDDNHPGILNGYLNFPEFDAYLPAKTGTFNLFIQHDNPGTKLMVYEMAFDWQDKSYFLAGEKVVHDDPGFDLWSDTTSLKVKLFEGGGENRKIIGAGILRLKLTGLIKLLKNLHVINAPNAADKINILSNFGAFFLGTLWDTYKGKTENEAREIFSNR